MTGGLIQLVATGKQDLYLTDKPEITFFKMVYRRHTNFTKETLVQKFLQNIDFGNKASCILTKVGDLINDLTLVLTLPKIPSYVENNQGENKFKRFAWVRKIGFALIKNIYIDIGGQKIDEHYGDWLNIWNELTGTNNSGFDRMIGDINELTDFTDGKPEYTLYIPLKFWFCGKSGLALPLVKLYYHEVKITVELNEVEKVYLVSPTNYIQLNNDIVNFKKYEYIEQTVLNEKAIGIFIGFDKIEKKMYYTKISNTNFKGLVSTSGDLSTNEIIATLTEDNYKIIGLDSKYESYPDKNSFEMRLKNFIGNLKLGPSYFLVEYIYLDSDERLKFSSNSHKYIIDYLTYSGEKEFSSSNISVELSLNNSCSELIWTSQLKYLNNYGFSKNGYQYFDCFNYTDNYILDENKNFTGKNNVLFTDILFNSNNRLERKDGNYYNWTQTFQNHSKSPSPGINIYSFSLHPEKYQPSGLCNMSTIQKITLSMKLNNDISFKNSTLIKIYSLNKNILTFEDGLASLEFVY